MNMLSGTKWLLKILDYTNHKVFSNQTKLSLLSQSIEVGTHIRRMKNGLYIHMKQQAYQIENMYVLI